MSVSLKNKNNNKILDSEEVLYKKQYLLTVSLDLSSSLTTQQVI